MGATYKNNLELTIFGESHGKAIGITIGNLPSGIQIDLDEVARDMKRRAPGQNKMSTARKEADQVEILSGLQDGITTGAPLTGVIYNSDQHSKDYSLFSVVGTYLLFPYMFSFVCYYLHLFLFYPVF